MPGHCYAMLQAIPELRDPDETGSYFSVQGFPNNCLNPAREETYRVLETIFDELIELFPVKTIHIGADEVPLGAWSGSPEALARLREIGGAAMADAHAKRLNVVTNTHGADEIEGSGAAVLQAEFLERIQTFLASRGCITGGWQEAAHGNVIDKAKCYLNGWRTVEVSAALAGEGYDIVVCPGPGLLSRHGQQPGLVGARRRLGRLVRSGKALSLRSGRRLDRGPEAPFPRRAELHLVGADDRPRRLRPAGVSAHLGAGRDRLDAARSESPGSGSRRWPG